MLPTKVAPGLRPIQHRTLSATVAHNLREAIQQHQLVPGARLRDDELALQLGVSHSTVREALHQLTHERLVIKRPHRGFFVAGFAFGDLLEMRGLLEGRIAEAAATDLSDDDFVALAAAAIGRVTPNDGNAFWEAALAFHEIILRLRDHPAPLHQDDPGRALGDAQQPPDDVGTLIP